MARRRERDRIAEIGIEAWLAERSKREAPPPGIEGDCLIWTAAISDGYGRLLLEGRTLRAHRFIYEHVVGPIPAGLTLDHLCRRRACVNPAHVEPTTTAENIARGTSPSAENRRKDECVRGHEFTPENTRMYRGRRICRACVKGRWKRERSAPTDAHASIAALK